MSAINWKEIRDEASQCEDNERDCHESTVESRCYATGRCPHCEVYLCDEHGPLLDVHYALCPLVIIAECGTPERVTVWRNKSIEKMERAENRRIAYDQEARAYLRLCNALNRALALAEKK